MGSECMWTEGMGELHQAALWHSTSLRMLVVFYDGRLQLEMSSYGGA